MLYIIYKELNIKLKELRSSNPKEYWRILSDDSKKKQNTCNPHLNITEMSKHFEKLNNADPISENIEADILQKANLDFESNTSCINANFTEEEILNGISKLKNNKAHGIDLIINEYLKCTKNTMIPVYVKLFNLILDTGIIPSEWLLGIIKPIYKNKGRRDSPDNYRGITILSCFGKLFTSLINARLTIFVEDKSLIGSEQAGFRKSYSTTDHIFTLKCIIDIYLKAKKKLYCAFIDFQKAFDTVNRIQLWSKLLLSGINGKLFNVIYNLYKGAKSYVNYNNQRSEIFSCLVGVRQGENLSPLLFAIFLNDAHNYLGSHYSGLQYLDTLLKNTPLELNYMIRIEKYYYYCMQMTQ
jgi:hypothetical protein